MNEKELFINRVMAAMMPALNDEQSRKLKWELQMQLCDYELEQRSYEMISQEQTDFELLNRFLEAKISARKAKSTVKYYAGILKNMLLGIGKPIKHILPEDIQKYLYMYQVKRKVNKTTARNIRAVMSSFFSWLRKNGGIVSNPMDLIEPIQPEQTIKEAFSDEEIVRMRDNCTTERDLALIDFLNASMVRVGELQKLNRRDIQFTERECIVLGKGGKERIAYFDGNAKIHLESYLKERTDLNPALFVSLRGKHERLTIGGIQDILRRLGKRAKVDKVHPHRFRRTGATRNLEKGMPIDQVKELLGHTKIETTMIYAKASRKIVKMNFQRLSL